MKQIITILLAAALIVCLAGLVSFAADGDSKSDPVEIIGTDTAEPPETTPPTDTGESTDTSSSADTTEPADTSTPVDTTEPSDTTSPDDTKTDSEKSIFEIWRGEPGRPFVFKGSVDEDGNGISGWALLNLICAIATVIFGIAATRAAIKVKNNKIVCNDGKSDFIVYRKIKSISEGEPKTIVADYIRKRKPWRSGFFDLICGVAAVIIFILTENIKTPMYLIDIWTIVMVAILAVSIVIWRLAAGGEKMSRETVGRMVKRGAGR